jgi:hypothetical protein
MRILLISLCCASLWGQVLPRTEAETLSGRKVTIPDVFGGKPAVVVFSFSKAAGEKTGEWISALSKDGAPVWSAAMLEAAPRFIRPMIRSGMKRDLSAAMLDRSLCLYAGEKAWRAALGVIQDDAPVVVLIDAKGQVAWKQQGVYSAEAWKVVKGKAAW